MEHNTTPLLPKQFGPLQGFDPYKNYKFQVELDNRVVAGISKVSALKRNTEVVEHPEGGCKHQPEVAGTNELRAGDARAWGD